MEHIIVSQITKHLQEHNILSDSQFGFRSQHSCESQLFVTLHDITNAVDNKLQVDTAILDFSKAFDKVAHSRLLYKLNYYGIRGNLLNWLNSFLHGRSQQAVVDGAKSPACEVTSGVPQGSVLGPTLFLIYINDIVLNVKSEIRLFADDILLYRTIKNPNDHELLQEDLNTLTKWAKVWLMEFNIPKCNILQISMHLAKRNFTYKMNDIPLNTVLEHDYLGVRLHHKLSWRPHVDHICNKASRLLGFLKRNLHSSPMQIKEYLYKQLLLPSIEYCSAIWDPYYLTDIKKIEMIQHRAVRFVLNKPWHKLSQGHDSVTEMLINLGWPELEERRKSARLTLLFKIVRGLLEVPARCVPQLTSYAATRAHHPLKLKYIYSRTDLHKNSFLPRSVCAWNDLDIANIDTISLNDFKKVLI